MKATHAMWSWLVVAVVGVFVVVVVAGLSLLPRLNAAQRVLDHGKPVFSKERVLGDRAGITMISHAVNTLDPIVTANGSAVAEVLAEHGLGRRLARVGIGDEQGLASAGR